MLPGVSLLLLLAIVAFLMRFSGGGLATLERHWVGRARVATLKAFGWLVLVTSVAAILLAVFSASRMILFLFVFRILGISMLFCFPLYGMLAFSGLFVTTVEVEEGPGLSAEASGARLEN